MNKLCYVLFVVAPFVVASEDEEILACVELLKPENAKKMCCEEIADLHPENDCEKDSNEDMIKNCNYPRCRLNSEGLLDDDDMVIDSKVKEMLDKQVKENPTMKTMSDRIKMQCLDGKYEAFPPKDACKPVKFLLCTYMNALVECSNWRTEDGCEKMADHAKKCKKLIDKDILLDF